MGYIMKLKIQAEIVFELNLQSTITFICGDSASGKSLMLASALKIGSNYEVQFEYYEPHYSKESIIFTDGSSLKTFENDPNSLYIICLDENYPRDVMLTLAEWFNSYRNFYLIIVDREHFGLLPSSRNFKDDGSILFSAYDIYKLSSTEDVVDLVPYLENKSVLTADECTDILFEDRSSAWKTLSPHLAQYQCHHLDGNGNIMNEIHSREMLGPTLKTLVLYDLACANGIMDKIETLMLFTYVKVWNYPSFEGFVLCSLFDIPFDDIIYNKRLFYKYNLQVKTTRKCRLETLLERLLSIKMKESFGVSYSKSMDLNTLLTQTQIDRMLQKFKLIFDKNQEPFFKSASKYSNFFCSY